MVKIQLDEQEVLVLIAKQITQLGTATTRIGGTIRFNIKGGGDWTLDLDQVSGSWHASDPSQTIDVTICIPAEHFSTLILAPESLGQLLDSGEVEVQGDLEKLAAVGELLAQQGSVISQRIIERQQGDKPC